MDGVITWEPEEAMDSMIKIKKKEREREREREREKR